MYSRSILTLICVCAFSFLASGQGQNKFDGKWEVTMAHKKDSVSFPQEECPAQIEIIDDVLLYWLTRNRCMASLHYTSDSLTVKGVGCTLVGSVEERDEEIYKYLWFIGEYTLFNNDSSMRIESPLGIVVLNRLDPGLRNPSLQE